MKQQPVSAALSAAVAAFVLGSCGSCGASSIGALFGSRTDTRVIVMSYNLQTMFDPVDQGGEYDDFSVAGGGWDAESYRRRVESLASSIRACRQPGSSTSKDGPDVLVVQEAENERVLRDLAESAGPYPYLVASPEEDAALGCGVISRWPPVAAKAHRARPSDGASPPRLVLEVDLDVDGRRLVVIAAHLKSKLGGAAETEAERMSTAALIAEIVASRLTLDPAAAIVVAGDFNENPDEYERVGRAYETALMPVGSGRGPWLVTTDEAGSASAEPLALYCPWADFGGYSYRYDGAEERIDQLLLSPAIANGSGSAFSFVAFSAEPPEFIVDAHGNPIRWDRNARSGYSDHLPIRVSLAYED